MIDKKRAAALLTYISDWCVEHRVGTGTIHETPEEGLTDSIFVNGNLARVLLCSYEIAGERSWLREAVSWCDYFVDEAAQPITTSRGNQALWWWDIGNTNLYLADTGTAVHALFKAYPHVDDERKKKYLHALEAFYLLIAEGTEKDPMDRGQEPSPGWIITEGEDAGSFGVGYRRGTLERRPYTVSTATAGAQACAAIYELTGEDRYRTVALNAAEWLLGQFRDDGSMPYRIEGAIHEPYIFQGLHYSLEGLLTSWLYLHDEAYNEKLIATAPRILEFILSLQNKQGFWGTEREYDGQRNAFLAHFLHWYGDHVADDSRAKEGAEKYANYVLDENNTSRHGVPSLPRVTGFVGLTIASFLSPELDLRNPESPIPLYDFPLDELRAESRRWNE